LAEEASQPGLREKPSVVEKVEGDQAHHEVGSGMDDDRLDGQAAKARLR
jgi:hypothetical protein